MSARDDYPCDMGMYRELDDTAAEAILAGRSVPDGDLALVAALVREARFLAHEAPPAPSPVLASLLAGDPVGASVFSPARPDRRPGAAGRLLPNPLARLVRNVAAAGLAAKIALGAGVAAASMTGAAAAGVLPGPVQDAVTAAVRAVTPFEFHGRGHGPDRPGDAGAESGGGGLVDAPGAPATGGTAPGGTPAIPGDPAPSAPEAPDGGIGGNPPSGTPVGSSPPTTGPGATPTTTAPPAGAGDPAAPPPVQEPAPATPQPAPTPEPAPTAPAPAPAEPTADAPIPVTPEILDEAPTVPVPAETGRP